MAQLKFILQIGRLQRRSIPIPWLIAILIIITQTAVPIAGESDCLRCEDFNRQPRKQFQCAKRYSECGDCISGFIEDPDDDRLCFALEILDISDDVMKDSESEVYLPCKFNARVKCIWSKDGQDVNIANSYKWSHGNGIETDDCSINIDSLSESDTGWWVCRNKADSNVNSLHSRDIVVSITPKITDHPKPTYNVSAGESVTVECRFDHPVKCSWMKDGRPIKSRTNYQFTDKEKTTDCSLVIRSFNLDNDQGNWTCLKPGNSEEEAIVSQTAQIRGHKSLKPVKDRASANNAREPTIYFGEHMVNRRTIEYVPGVSVDSLLSVSCRVWSGAEGMSWLLHGEAEHPGLKLGDTEISVDTQLETDLINRLQSQKLVELTCLVEYPDKESHSVIVTFVNDAPPSVQVASSLNSLFPCLIAIVIVMVCIVFAAIGFLIYSLSKRKNQCTAKNNKRTDSTKRMIPE